jgi:hypothetical protein
LVKEPQKKIVFSKGTKAGIQNQLYGTAQMIQKQCFRHYPIGSEVRIRSEQVSEAQKSVQSWIYAGAWLDVVLFGMVLGSAAGLAYTFLLR